MSITKRAKGNKKLSADYLYAKQKSDKFIEENSIRVYDLSKNTKKYKLLGLTIYKIMKHKTHTEHTFLNCIKWHTF